ncbi:MAG: hypothetical protein LEGION0398_MBIBDBAK_01065 [Legionellaceae bacterium]
MSKVSFNEKDRDAITAAIELLVEKGVDLSCVLEEEGLLKQLSKRLVEKALQSEMDNHLGYPRYQRADSDNARNGITNKNVLTGNGIISLDIPRDRESMFEPQFIQKRQTRIDGLDQKILSLYAKGMSLSDIRMQLQELYGAQISESLISRITDDVKAWQTRPLEPVYPIVFFDCLVVKVKQDINLPRKNGH